MHVTGTVTRGQGNFSAGSGILCSISSFANNGNFCTSEGAGYVAIRKGNSTTGQSGWIHLEVSLLDNTGATIVISERGVENLGNTPINSAITNNRPSVELTLPVEMLYFQTKTKDDDILLEWATASEMDNAGYEVQRSSDGQSFHKISWVTGRDTTSEQQAYSFMDTVVQPNTNYYYRLKQIHNDGKTDYSPVRSIMIEDNNLVRISNLFPNPTSWSNGCCIFNLHLPEESEINIYMVPKGHW